MLRGLDHVGQQHGPGHRAHAARHRRQVAGHLGDARRHVTQQPAAMAPSNDFRVMTIVSLCAYPLLALIRSPKSVAAAASREAAAHAVMD